MTVGCSFDIHQSSCRTRNGDLETPWTLSRSVSLHDGLMTCSSMKCGLIPSRVKLKTKTGRNGYPSWRLVLGVVSIPTGLTCQDKVTYRVQSLVFLTSHQECVIMHQNEPITVLEEGKIMIN